MTAQRIRRIAPLFFYLLIAVIALFPLIVNSPTHTGGEWTTDYYHFHWNFWWMRHALTHGLSIYTTDYVLFPFTTNLAFHTLTPFWFPAWALLEPLLGGGRDGTMRAMLVIMIAASALTGWLFYLWLRRQQVSISLALPFGAILQVCSGMMLAAMLTTINYLSTFWLPLALLTWDVTAEARGRARFAWGALVGVTFYAIMLTDYQHMLFLAFLLVPFGVVTLIRKPSWSERIRLALTGVLALVVMTALLWFIGPLPHIISYDFASLSPQPIESAGGIPFPAGYFSTLNTWDRVISLGALALPLTAIGICAALWMRTPRRAWLWLCLAIVPLLLSAGAVGGGVTAYTLLHSAFGGLFRSPARFDYVILIALLTFAGIALTPLVQRIPRHHFVVPTLLLIGVLIDTRLFTPMPVQPITRDYAMYHAIGEETGDALDQQVIVEIPVAGGSGEAWVGEFRPMEAHFYGITHGKRMLNGAIARAPLSHFWYWLYDDPMLAWLGGRRFLEPETVATQMRARLVDWQIGYFVVHGDWIGVEKPAFLEIINFFNSHPDIACPVSIEANTVFYRSARHPYGCTSRTPHSVDGGYLIDIGAPDDLAHIGTGWHYAESIAGLTVRWAGDQPEAWLYATLPPGAYDVDVIMQAYQQPRTVHLRVGEATLDETAIVSLDSLRSYRFTLPADVVGDGQHLPIALTYDSWASPADDGGNGDMRRLAVLVDTIRFTPR